MNETSERRCDGCGHLERDHSKQGCRACFKCTGYTPERTRDPKCRCLHKASDHGADLGRCHLPACRCAKYRPLVSNPYKDEDISVRSVPGGAFESNRRRH
jgi:hypothetical protein